MSEFAKLKWFRFSQNNSGGYFIEDENVCEEVFIQATSAVEAVRIAEGFMDNSDSCECCGDRWSFWTENDDGTDEPMLYNEPIWATKQSYFRKEARLHFFDGRIETVKFGEGQPPLCLGGSAA